MLNISKDPRKRRKALAIAAAQAIFSAGYFDPFHDKESVIAFLKKYKNEVNTPYGKIHGNELAKIIENEEIDLDELNLRLLTYKRRREKKLVRFIVDIVSDYISSDEADSIESIIEALKSIKTDASLYPDYYISPDEYGLNMITLDDVIRYLENARDRDVLLDSIRRAVRKKELDARDSRELQEYLDMVGEEYDVPVDVIELMHLPPNTYLFKVEIGGRTYLDEFDGTLDELKEVLSKEIKHRASEMKRFIEMAQNNMLKYVKSVSGFSNFLNEINNHVHKSAMITFMTKSGGEKWDINRRKNGFLTFGFSPSLWPKFYEHFIESISEMGGFSSVILRSFTDKVHTETRLPIKELRGYKVFLRNHEFAFEQLTVEELISAMNTDYRTGMRLPPEPAVIYCGVNGQISSDELIESIKRDILEELRNNIKINLKEPINKTDIFRGLADLVYELYKDNLNPRIFKEKFEKELRKLAIKGAHDPAGNLLYYIEYSEQLPAKIIKKLYGEYDENRFSFER